MVEIARIPPAQNEAGGNPRHDEMERILYFHYERQHKAEVLLIGMRLVGISPRIVQRCRFELQPRKYHLSINNRHGRRDLDFLLLSGTQVLDQLSDILVIYNGDSRVILPRLLYCIYVKIKAIYCNKGGAILNEEL